MTAVFNETVVIHISVFVHPSKGSVNVWPQDFNETTIRNSAVVCAGQHHKQWRGIDASVIFTERNFAKRSHFASSHFVKNLSGLSFRSGVTCRRLVRCQELQHAFRNVWVHPQEFKSSDDAVPSKNSTEPWHARVWIGAVVRLRHHHPNIGYGSIQPEVELFVCCFPSSLLMTHSRPRFRQLLQRVAVR